MAVNCNDSPLVNVLESGHNCKFLVSPVAVQVLACRDPPNYDGRGICICQDPHYLEAYKSKFS